jgi:dienelactone hydrolase
MSKQPLPQEALDRFGQILGEPGFTWERVAAIRSRGLGIRRTDREIRGNLVFTRLVFDADQRGEVPALLVHIDTPELFGRPCVLALHQTTEPASLGKAEPAGLAGNPDLSYGVELARRGAVVLIPDYPMFGSYAPDLDQIYEDWGYASMSQKALVNHVLALDVLQAWTGAANAPLGVIGHSLGGSNALFLAAHDPRVVACVCSAGFSSFQSYARLFPMGLAGWARRDKYMPRIAERFAEQAERLPSDFDDILSAIAPRPLFLSAPTRDDTFDCASVRAIVERTAPYWAGGDLVLQAPEATHSFPAEQREEAVDFLLSRLS